MKIGFNAHLLHSPTSRGWNRYTVNLLRQLAEAGNELILYGNLPLHEDHLSRIPSDRLTVVVSQHMRYVNWEQRWLPAHCAADGVDVLHSPFNFGLPWRSTCPRVLTLHDAITHAFGRRSLGEKLRPRALVSDFYQWVARSRADRIITPSEFSRQDINKQYGISESDIEVIPEAADPTFHHTPSEAERAGVRSRYGLDKAYIFYVGGWERRKNVTFLMRAYAEAQLPDVELLLAGGTELEIGQLSESVARLNGEGRIRLEGTVPDEDMRALYAEALCFVYPSLYEGFGLQLCEAMATGCPTLASSATSLPEVLGDGGETFDPNRTEELSTLLRRVSKEPEYRSELVSRALARSREFSWERTANLTLMVYQQVQKAR